MKQLEFTNRALAELFQQLALLTQAGIQLSDGLHMLADEEKDEAYRHFLTDTAQQVSEGALLSAAFEQANGFSSHAVGLLQMGEQVGRTEETLFSLARYYDDRDRMNRQLRNALTYPAILLLMMAVVIVVLLTRVLPVFNDVYASLGGSLTGLAAALLSFGNVLRMLLPYLGVVLVLLTMIAATVFVFPTLRKKFTEAWYRFYGDKGVARKMNNAHFAQALSMAISSGLPLEEGTVLAGTLLSDRPKAKQRCDVFLTHLQNGAELADALQAAELLTPSACRMLTLASRAGNADTTMQEIAARMTEEAEEAIENKVAQIEPALVLLTSVLVGAILLAVMLPLINIMKVIG